jgi:hypothetical protein
MLLATEYRLTANQLQTETPGTEQYEKLTAQKQQNLSELYYAIATLNRLDNNAEAYLENVQGIPQPNDINGYLLRDDVPEDFYLNFLSDYSQLFNRDANFLFTDSDYYAFPEYPNDPDDEWADISLDQMQNIPNEAERTFNPGNYMSLDQITTIFTGLRCVFDLVDPIVVQPTAEDSPMNLREEARAIVFRILDYIVNEETCPGSDPCYSFQIKDLQGRIKRAGSDMSANAPFIFSIGRHFNYPLFNDWVSEGLDNIRIAFMVDSPELLEKAQQWNWETILNIYPWFPMYVWELLGLSQSDLNFPIAVNYPCVGPLINRLEEKGNEPLNIGTIPLAHLMIVIDEMEAQNLPFITNTEELCIEITPELTSALLELEINVQGMTCDNVGLAFAKFLALVAYSSIGVHSTLLQETIIGAWVAILSSENQICRQTEGSNTVSEDNIHIIQELATISERLSAQYIHSIAEPSGLDYYSLLRIVLDPDCDLVAQLDGNHYREQFINTAPCDGLKGDPNFPPNIVDNSDIGYQTDPMNTPNGWASRNRLFHADDAQYGSNERSFRGEYSGIDFMVYYNLYHLIWGETPFSRSLACNCVEEITGELLLEDDLLVNRKFPSYRDMGIPIESFLAHSIVVDGATIDVKNDLIICREEPELVTSLQLSNEANLVLFGGNTIEVREGNMIVLNNAKLSGAIIDPTDPTYTESTIHFEAGAEFHILNGSELILGGGLTIIMDEGSKLIIDASNVTALESLYSNHFIIHGEETVVQLHNNSHYQSSAPVHWEFTDNASLSIRNSLVQSNQDHWSFHNQCSVSISHNSQCYFANSTQDMTANGTWVIDNSYFDVNASDLNINTGSDLHTNSTSFIIRNGGQVSIKNVFPNQQASHYYFDESTDLQIKGSESKLVFHGGKLHIPDNQIFTFTYPNAESGFIEVLAGTENMLHTGNNSIFLLEGEGQDDLILRIAPGAHIQNPNFSAGSMIFRDALVDMEGGAIYTDMFFKAEGVNFYSAGSAGNIWI